VSICNEETGELEDVTDKLPLPLKVPQLLQRAATPSLPPAPPGLQPVPAYILTASPHLHLNLRVRVPAGTDDKVRGFVILVLRAEELGPTLLYKRFATFATGVSFQGYVDRKSKDSTKMVALSSEAPTFVTNTDKRFFEVSMLRYVFGPHSLHLARLLT